MLSFCRLTKTAVCSRRIPVGGGAISPFGYTKEGMKAADLRGAFAVKSIDARLVQNCLFEFDCTLSYQLSLAVGAACAWLSSWNTQACYEAAVLVCG